MAQDYLFLNTRDYLLRLDINHIVYFEADGNYTHIFSANKVKHTVSMTLSKMHEILVSSSEDSLERFVRVGKSHIVCVNYISQIDIPKQTLVLSDGISFVFRVIISRDALRKLKNSLLTDH